jgi:hypothetical protein
MLVFIFPVSLQVNAVTSVTITFNVNGGNSIYNSVMTKTAGEPLGSLGNTPSHPVSGRIFMGWFTSVSGGQQITSNTETPSVDTTYYARWGISASKTITAPTSMYIQGWANNSYTSNEVTFDASSIPSSAVVTSIKINLGTSTMSGAIVGNYVQIRSSTRTGTLKFNSTCANNSEFTDSTIYRDKTARGLYYISWNGTVIGNTLGNILNPTQTMALRGFSKVKLTINYVYAI